MKIMDFLKDCFATVTGRYWVAFIGEGKDKILIDQDRSFSRLKERTLRDYDEKEITYSLW